MAMLVITRCIQDWFTNPVFTIRSIGATLDLSYGREQWLPQNFFTTLEVSRMKPGVR